MRRTSPRSGQRRARPDASHRNDRSSRQPAFSQRSSISASYLRDHHPRRDGLGSSASLGSVGASAPTITRCKVGSLATGSVRAVRTGAGGGSSMTGAGTAAANGAAGTTGIETGAAAMQCPWRFDVGRVAAARRRVEGRAAPRRFPRQRQPCRCRAVRRAADDAPSGPSVPAPRNRRRGDGRGHRLRRAPEAASRRRSCRGHRQVTAAGRPCRYARAAGRSDRAPGHGDLRGGRDGGRDGLRHARDCRRRPGGLRRDPGHWTDGRRSSSCGWSPPSGSSCAMPGLVVGGVAAGVVVAGFEGRLVAVGVVIARAFAVMPVARAFIATSAPAAAALARGIASGRVTGRVSGESRPCAVRHRGTARQPPAAGARPPSRRRQSPSPC